MDLLRAYPEKAEEVHCSVATEQKGGSLAYLPGGAVFCVHIQEAGLGWWVRREREEKDSKEMGRTPGTRDGVGRKKVIQGKAGQPVAPWWGRGRESEASFKWSARCPLVKADWLSYPQDMTTGLWGTC